MNDLQKAVALELQRVLEAGGYRAGALLVTREPLPGPELDTRVISAIGARDITPELAPDLVNLCKALRMAADELEAKWQPRREEPPRLYRAIGRRIGCYHCGRIGVPLLEWLPDPPRPDLGPFPLVCAAGCGR